MALVKKQLSRKRMVTLLLIVVIIAAGGAYFIFLNGASITQTPDDPIVNRLTSELSSLKRVNQTFLSDLEVLLHDVRFNELKQYGSLPVEVGPGVGRVNPFQPF